MRISLKLALVVAVVAGLAAVLLDEETKALLRYEALVLIMSPFIQLAWRTGIMRNALLVSYDDSDILISSATCSKEYWDRMRAYEPDENDVFIATYPKSGTHLIAQMTLQIVSEGTLEFENLHEYLPVVEMEKLTSENPECPDNIVGLFNARVKKKLPLNILATHLTRHHVPYSPKAKYIVMMRDPLDTLVSAMDMLAKLAPPSFTPPLEKYYEMGFTGGGQAWQHHYRAWWDMKDQDNVLFLYFEDALRNRTQMILQVSEFLGKHINEEMLERIMHRTSYEYMKTNSKRFEPPKCLKAFSIEPPKKQADMINKGTSGRGKTLIPEHIRRKIYDDFRQAFVSTDFPIERYIKTDI